MDCRATYFGTATLLLEIGPFRLLTDPVFDPPGTVYASAFGMARYRRIAPPPPVPELGRIDAVLLSHDQHGDNLDRSGLELARKAGEIVTTVAGARRLAGKCVGLAPWQTHELVSADGSRLTVTATPARHGPAILSLLSGDVVGFALSWQGQRNGALYLSGDTVLFRGVREVAKRFEIGAALLHVGRASFRTTEPAHFTFSAQEAAQAAELFPKAAILPVHYEGWSHFRHGRAEIERAFAEKGLQQRLRWLPVGEPAPLEV